MNNIANSDSDRQILPFSEIFYTDLRLWLPFCLSGLRQKYGQT